MENFRIFAFFISRIRQVSKEIIGLQLCCGIHGYIFTKGNFLTKFMKISCHKNYTVHDIG